MLDKLNNTLKAQIKEHAFEEFPKECCGLIVLKNNELNIVKSKNLFSSERKFCLDPDIIKKEGLENVEAIYHSHTHEDAKNFSTEDIMVSNRIKKDFLLYNIFDDEYKYHKHEIGALNLIDRPALPPILDCVTLIVDYYKQILNVEFKIKDHHNYFLKNKLKDFFLDNDFKLVDKFQKHDILLTKDEQWKIKNFSIALIFNSDNTFISYVNGFSKERSLDKLQEYKSEKIYMRHASLL